MIRGTKAHYPQLIGHPDGVFIEDDILYFKDCKAWMRGLHEKKALTAVGAFFKTPGFEVEEAVYLFERVMVLCTA